MNFTGNGKCIYFMMAYGVFKNVTTQSLFSGDCGSAIKVVIEYVAKLPTEQDEAECQHAKFQHFPMPFWPGLQYLDWRHLWAVFCGNTHSFINSHCWMNATLKQKLTLSFGLSIDVCGIGRHMSLCHFALTIFRFWAEGKPNVLWFHMSESLCVPTRNWRWAACHELL